MANLLECYKAATLCVSSTAKRSTIKRVQFAARLFFQYPTLISRIEEFFSATPVRRQIMEIPGFRRQVYRQQVRACFYRNSIEPDRWHFLQTHFQLLEKNHPEDVIRSFYTASGCEFTFQEGENQLGVSICYDHVISREGFLWLLISLNGVVLYKITFWLTEHNQQATVCIGTLQGGQDTLEANRLFTKEFWGLRPQNLALIVLRWYAQSMGVTQLYTFPREKLWCKKISEQTALDELWQEQGAQPVAQSPFIQLEMNPPQKTMEEIPTRKRSMYKKRFEFLERLGLSMETYFQSLLIDKKT